MKGIVYLVGAGPGDPGLITCRGRECLEAAEVVVYDRLAGPELLRHARADAELIYVGKEANRHALPQEDINTLLVERARAGQVVCRLQGGDHFVFGRGGEEAERLAQAGLPFEVVPGVTSAVAVPAYAGIPVTHRGYTASLAVATGHEDPSKGNSTVPWGPLAQGPGTLVFLMGIENLAGVGAVVAVHALQVAGAGRVPHHHRSRPGPGAVDLPATVGAVAQGVPVVLPPAQQPREADQPRFLLSPKTSTVLSTTPWMV